MSAVLAEADGHGAWLEPLFDVAFTAPDGMARLRQLILTLAMQGKLVPQLASEAPIPQKFRKEILSLNSAEVPSGWTKVKLADVLSTKSGNSKLIKGKLFSEAGEGLYQGYSASGADVWLPNYEYSKNAIVVSAVGARCGKAFLAKGKWSAIANTHIVFPDESVFNLDFAYLVFNDEKFWIRGGSAQPFVKFPPSLDRGFAIPPIEEQERIVACIDELMACCDDLERLRQQKAEKRAATRAATVRQWLAGDDAAAALLGEHFATLISTREDVAELRKAILQLAVVGRLVAQDPTDAPASELLKQIAAEKVALVKAGKIRAQKAIPPIADSEVPHIIPGSWEWVRLEDVVDVGTGSTPTTTNPRYYGGSIPWYTSSATNRLVADEPEKFITDLAIKETNCKVFPVGTLIIALYGQGKTRGQVSEITQAGATNQAIAALVFSNASAPLRRYLKYFFIKSYEALREQAAGAAQPNLNVGKIKETLIPLPPLEEQKRIVSRIDALMRLCDTLEQSIDAAQAKQAELLGAVMARV